MSFLRLWLLATGTAITAGVLWAFAPILIFVLLLAGGLGLLAAAIVMAARRIEHRRGGAQPIELSRGNSPRDRRHSRPPEHPD